MSVKSGFSSLTSHVLNSHRKEIMKTIMLVDDSATILLSISSHVSKAGLLAERLLAYEETGFSYAPIAQHLESLYDGYLMEQQRTTHERAAASKGEIPRGRQPAGQAQENSRPVCNFCCSRGRRNAPAGGWRSARKAMR
jgi:hypothetical protein